MGILLSDYIKDPKNVFTEEEAKKIYEAAGYKLHSSFSNRFEKETSKKEQEKRGKKDV